jgi:hypothetical protein
VPSHHGQLWVDGEPPRLEITVPVPRQTVQGTGSSTSDVSSSALTAWASVANRSGGHGPHWSCRAPGAADSVVVMQHLAPSSSAARESAMRAGLLALAVTNLVLGLWLAFAPGTFYDALANFGPRGDHFLRDNAMFYLAAAPLLALSVGRPSWRAPILALVGLQYGLHAINHLVDIGDADPSWVGPFDFVTLALGAVLIFVMLAAALRDDREAGR